MSVLEIIQFTTHPTVEHAALEAALSTLDRELAGIGGFESRTLYREAGTMDGWLLEYRWTTLPQAQESMEKVAATEAFMALMTLVSEPQAMRMLYGTRA